MRNMSAVSWKNWGCPIPASRSSTPGPPTTRRNIRHIFHPAHAAWNCPEEIDWLAGYTAQLGEEAARRAIEYGRCRRLNFPGLRAFAARFSRIMVKGAAESGGRGQRAFTLRDAGGQLDEQAIAEAVDFTYNLSLVQNVAIQEIIIASPEHWASEEFMASFVDRQVQEWDAVVNRTRRPRTNIYGSHRLIFSTDAPGSGKWHVSHPITLNSRQLITNVGRGGTLDLLRPEFIRPEFRDTLWRRLVEAGEKCMNALAGYVEIAGEQYVARPDAPIGEDATGLSYACPRYMMLDFLVQPIFDDRRRPRRPGTALQRRRRAHRRPIHPAARRRARHRHGKRLARGAHRTEHRHRPVGPPGPPRRILLRHRRAKPPTGTPSAPTPASCCAIWRKRGRSI